MRIATLSLKEIGTRFRVVHDWLRRYSRTSLTRKRLPTPLRVLAAITLASIGAGEFCQNAFAMQTPLTEQQQAPAIQQYFRHTTDRTFPTF
jgi:hypothetical protein